MECPDSSPCMCVNFKQMALLVAKHEGCSYTPGCGCAPPSPTGRKFERIQLNWSRRLPLRRKNIASMGAR